MITGSHPKGTSSSGRRPGYQDHILHVEAAQQQIRDDHGVRDHLQGAFAPSGRAGFLERIGRGPVPHDYTLTKRLAEADKVVELTERDTEMAWAAYTRAKAAFLDAQGDAAAGIAVPGPDEGTDAPLLARRSLNREAQHLQMVYNAAEQAMTEARGAHDAALARRSRLEAELSGIPETGEYHASDGCRPVPIDRSLGPPLQMDLSGERPRPGTWQDSGRVRPIDTSGR